MRKVTNFRKSGLSLKFFYFLQFKEFVKGTFGAEHGPFSGVVTAFQGLEHQER
jgi:hypothetical protein